MYQNAIADKSGETGVTFDGVLSYMMHHRPVTAVFENVLGLKGVNLNSVKQLCANAGYLCTTFELNTSDFFLPQSRPRPIALEAFCAFIFVSFILQLSFVSLGLVHFSLTSFLPSHRYVHTVTWCHIASSIT